MGFLPLDLRPEPELVVAFDRVARVLDAALMNNPFVVGEAISIADLAIAADLGFATEAALPVAEYPGLARWLTTMQGRQSWQETERRKLELLRAIS